jgi:indole-3-glycerol phosphate synthase
MDILASIMAERKQDVAVASREIPLSRLRREAGHRKPASLAKALRARHGTAVIAELKKASPSAGLLRPDYQPGRIAAGYAAAGAVAVSVLTEPRHFLGSADHLREVRRCVHLPILRKDFLCDSYQVAEAAAWGADVVLLIVAALDRATLHRLYREALDFGLEVLAEAHTAEELDLALELEHAIVGVNSRNLKTLKTDLAVARNLAAGIPDDRLAIAESGIHSRADVLGLEKAGYDGFLIGEALLRGADPAEELRGLTGRTGAGVST